MTGGPALSCSDLFAGYRRTVVVRDVTCEVSSGTVLAVVGPNGAGKTTLLSTLAGMLPPIEGQVRLNQELVSHRQPHKCAQRGLSFVPEDRALFRSLTVIEHLRVAVGRRNSDAIAHLLDQFPGLARKRNVVASVLSGGEQQLLALARALIRHPTVLLLDEMSLGLAPQIVAELMTLLRRSADEEGTAIVLVEQHSALALSIADQAIVLVHGDVVYQGAPSALRNDPQLLAEMYIGSSARSMRP